MPRILCRTNADPFLAPALIRLGDTNCVPRDCGKQPGKAPKRQCGTCHNLPHGRQDLTYDASLAAPALGVDRAFAVLGPVVLRFYKAKLASQGAKEGSKGILFEVGHWPRYARLCDGVDLGEAVWFRKERARTGRVDGARSGFSRASLVSRTRTRQAVAL